MTRHSTRAIVLVALTCQLAVPNRGVAQTAAPASSQPASVEDAIRLTWSLDTRPAGVVALQTIVSDRPDDTNARFELGRVLTWNAETRGDGIAHLRRVLEQAPRRTDAAEALAEVLSWDAQTRAEAIQRFRALLGEEPARTSARLKLAEVLSWEPATRDESRELYLRVQRDEPQSESAALGLGRLLAWRGRTRASLQMLSSEAAIRSEAPDAFRLRAQAYTAIGRPARALAEYERLLAVAPADATALRETRLIRRALRPSLEVATESSTESGDAASKVEWASVPVRIAFHPAGGDLEVSVTATQASYRNGSGSSRDRLAGAGLASPVGNRLRVSGDVLAHDFDRGGRTLTGRSQVQVAVHDGYEIRVGASREQLDSSRLSLAGEQIGDTFYGPSFVTQVTVAGSASPAAHWDVWGAATAGRIRGENVPNNSRHEAFAGFGRSFRLGAATVRPGYSFARMSYRRDLSGFSSVPPGDGVSAAGIGGYFSPREFVNQMARVDATVPISSSLSVFAGAGAGRQRVEDSTLRGVASGSASSDGYLGVTVRASERVSVRTHVNYQDVASAFNHVVARLSVTYGF